jgi:hypothetical protein
MTLLVADVALGECKDFGYGSQSCPNDDFEAWCEEGANRAQCGNAVAEDKRLTPSRPPILQVTYRDSVPACPASAHPRMHCDMRCAAAQRPRRQTAFRGPAQLFFRRKLEPLRHDHFYRGRLEHAPQQPGQGSALLQRSDELGHGARGGRAGRGAARCQPACALLSAPAHQRPNKCEEVRPALHRVV